MSVNATRWPIYIPSKGRYSKDTALTVAALRRDRVPFFIMVEPQEAEHYERLIHGSEGTMLVLPFSNLGLGSIPARNFGRDHAIEGGHARHWDVDDNIIEWRRLWRGRRIPCDAGAAFRLVEDFTDRFSNVGVSGCNYQMFVPSETPKPFYRNVHVYSMSLVNHAMGYRWRGKYNEDTDLCLQALANGWATILVNVVMANKLKTMASKGGNDAIYDMGADGEEMENHTDTDGRYAMARALEKLWPGVVRVSSRYGRYQHYVNWGAYAGVKLKLRDDFDYDALPEVDERDFVLRAVTRPKSPQLCELLDNFEADAAATTAPDLWRGMPAFDPFVEPPKYKFTFSSVKDQEALVEKFGVVIAKRTGPALSAWYPRRDRQDLASLRFESSMHTEAGPREEAGSPPIGSSENVSIVPGGVFSKILDEELPEPENPMSDEEREMLVRAEEELGDREPQPEEPATPRLHDSGVRTTRLPSMYDPYGTT